MSEEFDSLRDCEHGNLRRTCELCEKDAEIVNLRSALAELEREFRKVQAAYAAMDNLSNTAPVGCCTERLNLRHQFAYAAADAFWAYWKYNGETHKHGYYESTWGAINAAIKMVGTVDGNHEIGARAAPHIVFDDEIRAALNDAVHRMGSKKQVASAFGVSESFLGDVTLGRRAISQSIANRLGYEPIRAYLRRDVPERES